MAFESLPDPNITSYSLFVTDWFASSLKSAYFTKVLSKSDEE